MISIFDGKIMIMDESVYNAEDMKVKINMISKFYKIPKKNIMADRNFLNNVFGKQDYNEEHVISWRKQNESG